jgi:putative aldouronate transport system permease protein
VASLSTKATLVSTRKHSFYYFLMLPGIAFFIIYKYVPLLGIIVAFKDVAPFDGLAEIISAPFVGFKNFTIFFNSIFFWDVLRNTFVISFMYLCFGFPAPIILALLINEVRDGLFKKSVQTISYLPHFLSMVVVAGMISNILSPNGGLLNSILKLMGSQSVFFLGDNKYIRWVFTFTAIWQEIGWSSIVYLAALAGIPEELYEAAIVDGASRWQQIIHVTLPGMMPIISIMFILQIGKILDGGFERVLLLYNPSVYENADIIDTFVYRKGLNELQYSFSTAVGLFKSIIVFIVIYFSNWSARKLGQESLW